MKENIEGAGLRFRTAESGLEYAAVADESLLGGLGGYERAVAEGQLHDFGAFFVGRFGDVLDDDYEVAEAAADWKGSR